MAYNKCENCIHRATTVKVKKGGWLKQDTMEVIYSCSNQTTKAEKKEMGCN